MSEDKLAIDGGTPAVTIDQDPLLRWPQTGPEEVAAVSELVRAGDMSASTVPDQFAAEFREFLGGVPAYYLPENSGTAALYSAFFAAGVKPGTEVIGPAYTYWATTGPAAALGAKVVFAEIDEQSLCLDPEDFQAKITPKTRAVVPVHVWGWPCEMDAIVEIARDHDVVVIEDASHAHGAKYKGQCVGTIGDIGCYSFQNSKLVPAGEGGMFLTDNETYFETATALGHYVRVKDLEGPTRRYGHTGFGFKFRMSPLHAAIGRVQLRKYPRIAEWTRQHSRRFRACLARLPGFHVHEPPSHVERVYYENVVQFDVTETDFEDEQELLWLLRSEGVRVSDSRYQLLHKEPFYAERDGTPQALPRTERVRNQLLRFPNFPTKREDLVDQYCHALEKVFELYEPS